MKLYGELPAEALESAAGTLADAFAPRKARATPIRALRPLLTLPGVRVIYYNLDVGSGMGDVAFLVSELVGPGGEVVGAEREPSIAVAASARANATSRTSICQPSSEAKFDKRVGTDLPHIKMCSPDAAAAPPGVRRAWRRQSQPMPRRL
jgi:protein-L-isoaspartate(D-aspartate) O-methyltransferase (PCMT)